MDENKEERKELLENIDFFLQNYKALKSRFRDIDKTIESLINELEKLKD